MVRHGKKFRILAIVLVLAAVLGCWAYVGNYYHADDTAMAALAAYTQEAGGLAVFEPESPAVGLIFYPGGKVEYTAYAPLMAELARQNILCVVAKMPGNLAVLDVNAAAEIPAQFPEVERWYIGGHSLGGSMAASYAAKHTAELEGLILLAAYSTEAIEDLAVLSLYGTEDDVLDLEKYESYHENLPADAEEIIIPGGNHAQFGSYGPQEGDGTASISAEEQIQITADSIAAFMG